MFVKPVVTLQRLLLLLSLSYLCSLTILLILSANGKIVFDHMLKTQDLSAKLFRSCEQKTGG